MNSHSDTMGGKSRSNKRPVVTICFWNYLLDMNISLTRVKLRGRVMG